MKFLGLLCRNSEFATIRFAKISKFGDLFLLEKRIDSTSLSFYDGRLGASIGGEPLHSYNHDGISDGESSDHIDHSENRTLKR